MPVDWTDVKPAKSYEKDNDKYFDNHRHRVEPRTLANPDYQQDCNKGYDDKRRSVNRNRMTENRWQVSTGIHRQVLRCLREIIYFFACKLQLPLLVLSQFCGFIDPHPRPALIFHQPQRKPDVRNVIKKLGEELRPSDRDCYIADGVFQYQIPADDPGDKLTQRRI